jgi:photosystem II stability/assembly factor-like uncharacterized protein
MIASNALTDIDVISLAIDPRDPATIYAGIGYERSFDQPGGVFKSTDGGTTWSSANTGLAKIDIRALAIDPETPAVIYAGVYDGGVFKTTDGGASWSVENAGLSDTRILALAIDPTAPATIYAGAETGGIFKSTDGGESWLPTGLTKGEIRVLAVDPNGSNALYAGATSGLIRSTDGGATWVPINKAMATGCFGAFVIDPFNPNPLYAGGYTLYKSTRVEVDWRLLNPDLHISCIRTLVLGPTSGTTIYAGTEDDGVLVFRYMDLQ